MTSNIKLIMPNPAHVNISAAGVAKSAKNKEEAIKFIEFISPGCREKRSGRPLLLGASCPVRNLRFMRLDDKDEGGMGLMKESSAFRRTPSNQGRSATIS